MLISVYRFMKKKWQHLVMARHIWFVTLLADASKRDETNEKKKKIK